MTLPNTYTHTDRHVLGTLWTMDQPLATHNIHMGNIHITGHIRTRIATNQAATDLRFRARGQRNWRL